MNYRRRLKTFGVVEKSRTGVHPQTNHLTPLSWPFLHLLRVVLAPVCFFVFVILPCCTHLKTPLTKPPQQSCSLEDILLKVRDTGAPQGLKGLAKVKVKSAGEKFSVKELIVAQKPNLLRLETLNPLGHPQFFAVTNGEELYFFAPSENRFYYGNASPSNMSSFLPLSLSLENVVPLVLGGIPLIDYDAEQVGCQVMGDYFFLQLWAKDGDTRQVLTVGSDNLRVMESRIYHKREELYFSATFEDYEMTGEVLFPKKITIFMPEDDTTVTINYKKLEFLTDVDPAKFQLTVPQGAEVVHLQ